MSYSTGTVVVTRGAAAVIGTGTLWLTNAVSGDTFIGPDGRSYIIAARASDTVLTLDGPYRGRSEILARYAIHGVVGGPGVPFRDPTPHFASRAAFEAAVVQDWVTGWSFYHLTGPMARPVRLEFIRDPNGVAVTSANGVRGSPAGDPEALHYGILPGAIAPPGRIEAASADCAARGQWLTWRGSDLPYQIDDTVIRHCHFRGSGASGKWSNGQETVIQSVGPGTPRRWHDRGTGNPADDISRPMIVNGRSELQLTDIRIDNAAKWDHDILVPAMRGTRIARVTTGGASGVSVVFDQSWSDRNMTLRNLHPTIQPGAGCNECMTEDCDLGGDVEGLGIIGTVRDPADYPGTAWLWGWGGASDFQDIGSRITGLKLDAACGNAAGMVQGIYLIGTAYRVGSRTDMITLDRVTRVITDMAYGEATDGNLARINVTSRTAANGTEKIIFRNCDLIRHTIWMDGVDTGASINNGGSPDLPFLDVSDTLGNRWTAGLLYGAGTIRPRVDEGASLGTGSYQFNHIRGARVRSNREHLWFRTHGASSLDPAIYLSFGNRLIRGRFGQNSFDFYVPGIAPPFALDGTELPVDPEVATHGVRIIPTGVVPATDDAAALGSSSKGWSSVWLRRLRSSAALSIEAAGPISFRIADLQHALLSATGLQLDVPLTGSAVAGSSYDVTSGRVWTNVGASGMFGWGATGALASVSELNDSAMTSGVYRLETGYAGVGQLPGPLVGFGVVLMVDRYSGSSLTQTVYRQTTTLAGGVWRRVYNNSAWGPWGQIAPAALVGTVSQTGGVPTGALSEWGIYPTGEYVRYVNGLQICTARRAGAAVETAVGSIYRSGDITWTYPVAFASEPRLMASCAGASNFWASVRPAGNGNTVSAIARLFGFQSEAYAWDVNFIAIGRWF